MQIQTYAVEAPMKTQHCIMLRNLHEYGSKNKTVY